MVQAEAFGVVQAEKRNWTRALARSRAMAEFGCYYDHVYVRMLFAPAAERPRRGRPAVQDDAGAPATGSDCFGLHRFATITDGTINDAESFQGALYLGGSFSGGLGQHCLLGALTDGRGAG